MSKEDETASELSLENIVEDVTLVIDSVEEESELDEILNSITLKREDDRVTEQEFVQIIGLIDDKRIKLLE
jgi:hypothetical protein